MKLLYDYPNILQTEYKEFLLGGYAPQTLTPGRPSASWPGPGPKGREILVKINSYIAQIYQYFILKCSNYIIHHF